MTGGEWVLISTCEDVRGCMDVLGKRKREEGRGCGLRGREKLMVSCL